MGDGSGSETPTTDIFRELSGSLNVVGTGICSNMNSFVFQPAFHQYPDLIEGYDKWEYVHGGFGDPAEPYEEFHQLPPDHKLIGWFSQVYESDTPQRVGLTVQHSVASTQTGPQLYTHNFYGTWANEGFALLQVEISHLSVTLSERQFYPGVITNYPWDLCSLTRDNPCLWEYAGCTWWEAAAALSGEETVIDQPTYYSEIFEVDNVKHLIGSGVIHPPSEYGDQWLCRH